MDNLTLLGKRWGDAQGLRYIAGSGAREAGVYLRRRGETDPISHSWIDLYNEFETVINLWGRRITGRKGLSVDDLASQLRSNKSWDALPGARNCLGLTGAGQIGRGVGKMRTLTNVANLGVIAAMLGEPDLYREETNPFAHRYLFQPAKLRSPIFASYNRLSVFAPAGSTVLLQWSAPSAKLKRVYLYTSGLSFTSYVVSQQIITLKRCVRAVEAFVVERCGILPERWPAVLPFVSVTDAPDYLLMALDKANADVVDSGYSFPFVFPGVS